MKTQFLYPRSLVYVRGVGYKIVCADKALTYLFILITSDDFKYWYFSSS